MPLIPKAKPKAAPKRQANLTLKIDPGPRMKESDLQRQIIQVLSGLGYTVLFVGWSRRKVICKKCKFADYPGGDQGNAPGVSDLLVSRKGWPAVWAGLEVKVRGRVPSQDTRIRLMQKLLADEGRNVIVYSVAEAIDAMQIIEAALGFEHPRLESFWENNPRRLFE